MQNIHNPLKVIKVLHKSVHILHRYAKLFKNMQGYKDYQKLCTSMQNYTQVCKYLNTKNDQ